MRDIDSDGAFVETGGCALYPKYIVELAIAVRRQNRTHVSIRAMVVRRTDDEVGLLFTNYSLDFYQQMETLIEERRGIITPGKVARRRNAAVR